MSSLLRSFASLYCQKLRSTTTLGPAAAAAPRFQAINGQRFSASSGGGAADTRPPQALPRQYEGQQRTTTFFTWARLAIGSVLAAVTPFLASCTPDGRRSCGFRVSKAVNTLADEVEMVKDTTEAVAEIVEEVATAAEKMSSEQLPEGGRLRTAAVLLEHASKEVAQEAHLAQDIIHKVDEIEEDVKAIIEPIVDHSRHHVHDAKAHHISNSSQK